MILLQIQKSNVLCPSLEWENKRMRVRTPRNEFSTDTKPKDREARPPPVTMKKHIRSKMRACGVCKCVEWATGGCRQLTHAHRESRVDLVMRRRWALGGLSGAFLSTAAQTSTAYKYEREDSYTASWTSELRERFGTLGPGLLDALGSLVHDPWW